MTKKCKTCGQEKDITEFWTNPKTKDKLKPSCIVCCKEYNKTHYENSKKPLFGVKENDSPTNPVV